MRRKGGHLHNQILLETIKQRALRLGLNVVEEQKIAIDGKWFYGDLFIEHDGKRILIEAENSSERVENDLIKAEALKAELLILVPNPKIAKSVKRKLLKLSVKPGKAGKLIFYISQVIRRLEQLIELNTRRYH